MSVPQTQVEIHFWSPARAQQSVYALVPQIEEESLKVIHFIYEIVVVLRIVFTGTMAATSCLEKHWSCWFLQLVGKPEPVCEWF